MVIFHIYVNVYKRVRLPEMCIPVAEQLTEAYYWPHLHEKSPRDGGHPFRLSQLVMLRSCSTLRLGAPKILNVFDFFSTTT